MIGWLRERLPLGRVGTILVVYLAFFIVVVGMAFVVVPAAVNQGQRILAALPAFFDQVRLWAEDLRPVALSTSITALVDSVAEFFAPRPATETGEVVEVGTAVAEAALFLFTMLAVVFFWLVEHARLQRYSLAFLPADRRAGARNAWNEIETRLGLWVRGQLILMGSMGVATGVAYTLLGLPGALLLGLIAALTEAIPIVGPLLGAIPAILVAATVSPELALVVALIYVVLQLIEGNVLVPLVMRNTIGISPLLVLFSLLVGRRGRRAAGRLPRRADRRLDRDRPVPPPGPRNAGRPGPGRHRVAGRGDDRRVQALIAGRRQRLVEVGGPTAAAGGRGPRSSPASGPPRGSPRPSRAIEPTTIQKFVVSSKNGISKFMPMIPASTTAGSSTADNRVSVFMTSFACCETRPMWMSYVPSRLSRTESIAASAPSRRSTSPGHGWPTDLLRRASPAERAPPALRDAGQAFGGSDRCVVGATRWHPGRRPWAGRAGRAGRGRRYRARSSRRAGNSR